MARAGGRPRASLPGGTEEASDLYVQALARGLSILALFDVEHPEWSLHDICRQTGISKTTAYRMLRTLEWKGFVTFDSATERYHLGPATIPGAYLSLSNVGFVRFTHPLIEDLAARTGETVELTVEGVGGAVVVDQVATSAPLQAQPAPRPGAAQSGELGHEGLGGLPHGRGARAAAAGAPSQAHPKHRDRPGRHAP